MSYKHSEHDYQPQKYNTKPKTRFIPSNQKQWFIPSSYCWSGYEYQTSLNRVQAINTVSVIIIRKNILLNQKQGFIHSSNCQSDYKYQTSLTMYLYSATSNTSPFNIHAHPQQ